MPKQYPTPPFPEQQQPHPGLASRMDPVPDHGETSYQGDRRLAGKKALITGGDSGIGRAVAIAFAREGADVAISYLNEEEDAAKSSRPVAGAACCCRAILQAPTIAAMWSPRPSRRSAASMCW